MGVGVFGTGDAATSLLLSLIFTSAGSTPPNGFISAGQSLPGCSHQPARDECHQRAKVACSRSTLSWATRKEGQNNKQGFFLIQGHGGRRPKPQR